ncbi:MAG: lipid-A-disaccharide synthase [Candidatus Sabulitectum sp.]|nr:lipid-A-disaccharide synthase [Candidatus Sabulitectum sp.]
MKLLISAGEASGDQRAAEVLSALKRNSSDNVEAFGLGGIRLAAEGMKLTHNLSSYAVMGFGEILRSLGRFLRLEKDLKDLCAGERPDCILLVDFPGFNMRLGRWAKKEGIPVVHYVAPQMWAWGRWRVRKLKKSTDILLTLFSFEEHFFNERGVRTVFTGHPLIKQIPLQTNNGKALGLLPGSREQEVEKLLPAMLQAFTLLRKMGLVDKALLAVSDHLDKSVYMEAENTEGVILLEGTGQVLSRSRAALVCSGTATLETALYGVPFVVCYKTSSITYALARFLVKGVKNIGLANIIAEDDVAPELIQNNVTPANMVKYTESLFSSSRAWEKAVQRLSKVRSSLGNGDPAENAAREIIAFMERIDES